MKKRLLSALLLAAALVVAPVGNLFSTVATASDNSYQIKGHGLSAFDIANAIAFNNFYVSPQSTPAERTESILARYAQYGWDANDIIDYNPDVVAVFRQLELMGAPAVETLLPPRAAAAEEEDDADTDDSNDTVTTSSGEVMTSAAAINVNSITSAVVRTPQSEMNAAVAGAVGGLREGQSVAVTVGDSQCGELARQAVTNAASSVNGKVASYLEITVDLYTPGEPSQQVAQLSAPIEFAVSAPEGIDGNQYDFAVIRLHGDGRVDILPDLDDDPATITFRTDRFSVYAVIYGPKGAFKSASGKDSVPKTGDSTVPVLPFAAAGMACAAAAVVLKRKERQ